MGKGVIVSGGEGGLYNVKVKFHCDRITAIIALLTKDIKSIDSAIEKAGKELTAIQAKITGYETEISVLEITDKDGNKKKIISSMTKLSEQQILAIACMRKIDYFKLQIAAAQKKIKYLTDNMPAEPVISTWCADLTENLLGDIGTVEVPNERRLTLIQPGFTDKAVYDVTRDGIIQPSIAGTEAGVFYNMAMFPGWGKWMPTYRTGVITSLNGDLCDLTLDNAVSSAQALDINLFNKLTNVPIEYMD